MNPHIRAIAAFVLAAIAFDAALAQDKQTPKGMDVLGQAACDQWS